MREFGMIMSVAVCLGISTGAAGAADLGRYGEAAALEQQVVEAAAEPPYRQFYIRGDVALARYGFDGFSQLDLTDNGGQFISEEIGNAPVVAAGFGWQWSNNWRVDFTGEYRATAVLRGIDDLQVHLADPDGQLSASTSYSADYQTFVGLANFYYDIAKWHDFTPYVGAGLGFAVNDLSNLATLSSATFVDDDTGAVTNESSTGAAAGNRTTKFAWALMAGSSYDLNPHLKFDFGYRYINLGSDVSVGSDIIVCNCGALGNPLKVSELDAHEIRIGLRWQFDGLPSGRHEPLK